MNTWSPRWVLQSQLRAWLAFSLVIGLLFLAAIGLVRQELRQNLDATQQAAQRELALIGSLVSEALRRGQYQSLDFLLRDWGASHAHLTELRVVGQNGFVLSTYNSGAAPTQALTLSLPIDYSYHGRATLNLTHDLAEVHAGNAALRNQLLLLILALSGLLGVVMFLLLKRQEEAAVLRSHTVALDAVNASLHAENAQRRMAEEALFQAKERAEVTLYSIGDAVITTDAQGVVDYLNPVAEALTGWTSAEAKGQLLSVVFPIFNETTQEVVENPVARCLCEGVIVGLANHTLLITRDGREIAIEDSTAPIRARSGEITGVVMVFHDVTQSRVMAHKLSWQAAHDALTGLVNRREFENRLQNALAASHAEGQQHALLYIDLDQFKIVNDTCGHVAGDELLRELSALLQSHMRASDTLARLGGDEFGVLLEHCPLDQAQRIAEGLRTATRDFRLVWENKTFEVSASMGIVAINRESGTMSQVLSAADMACYVAKERGRNRFHVYQESDADFARRHGEMLWVTRLNQALRDHRFVLYRQEIRPIEAIQPGSFYEVLLRIRNEDGTLSLPGSFLPAAERYDLMCAIDRWVIQHLFAAPGLLPFSDVLMNDENGLTLATINLSGASLNDETFLDFVRDSIKQYNINPRTICFEITETVAISHFDRAIRLVTALREIGCRFALDDFGSGLSSFGYLKNLPMDFLKIDGGLVRYIVDNPIDAAMVEAINAIGHVMGLKTIAEYVENDAIRDKLVTIGVDYIQGFGIEMPQPFPIAGSKVGEAVLK
ncbi:MAG: EAL domain-containing protein [Burkholderiales bacterium]|nr:EAL domain-containing protein [Burkholderiales bacterium]